jgi:hypothetical protein
VSEGRSGPGIHDVVRRTMGQTFHWNYCPKDRLVFADGD